MNMNMKQLRIVHVFVFFIPFLSLSFSCLFLSYIMNVKLSFFALFSMCTLTFSFFSLLFSSYENLSSRRWDALYTNRLQWLLCKMYLYSHTHDIKASHIKLVLTTTSTTKITNDHNNRCTKVEWHLNWKHTQPV